MDPTSPQGLSPLAEPTAGLFNRREGDGYRHDTDTSRSPTARGPHQPHLQSQSQLHVEPDDNDVPESLLLESNSASVMEAEVSKPLIPPPRQRPGPDRGPKTHIQWESIDERGTDPAQSSPSNLPFRLQPKNKTSTGIHVTKREAALWRWVNVSNLDNFMRDVYDYYEGGGIWCIMCANALWLLETLFVAVLLTFLTQCVDYDKIPKSKSLDQVIINQCTRKMSVLWSLGIWMYSFFFFWKAVQYFLEIRRLSHIRDFYRFLLEIPEQDMQTVSWQDIVGRVMLLRDQNPKTATNTPARLRKFLGSQSKERLDAHDIANRLMRKENYLIAMINKDVLNLSLPIPFLKNRQLFSKTMEWYLHYSILDMAFTERGEIQQDFLRADRRRILSQKLRQRLVFAGILNLIFAPVVLAYVIIVYFFTYYNEYQKDPKLATARKYTALAEWKFREFNELPHIFYERLHMSYPFATRYLDQFPKRLTEDVARSIAFMSGAITAVLAVCTVLDSELFLGFEITKDRTVLFYLGVFGAIWAMTRGMISEETMVFNPEYALRNVIEYTHYMPDHWEGRLHSFEVKQEFSELYKMKVIIFLEEVMGIITTPMLLLFSLPNCSDQIVDFFREFTVHVDGLGYVCSFALFDFSRGVGNARQKDANPDVREEYYSTKHGKMAASYYGFLDNYVINPKTGIPGHMPPGMRQSFHHPPAFPSLNSPTLAADLPGPSSQRMDGRRGQTTNPPGLMQSSSVLLDAQASITGPSRRTLHRSQLSRMGGKFAPPGIEEAREEQVGYSMTGADADEDLREVDAGLGESTWQTSPAQGLSREQSSNAEGPDGGVLGMIHQFRQAQHGRRAGSIV